MSAPTSSRIVSSAVLEAAAFAATSACARLNASKLRWRSSGSARSCACSVQAALTNHADRRLGNEVVERPAGRDAPAQVRARDLEGRYLDRCDTPAVGLHRGKERA